MCGLIGVISQERVESLTPHLMKACDAIIHRGPDDDGVQIFENAFLGFRRLSIIDLSQNGHQPMSDTSSRYCIVFNGEIYNFQGIRDRLITKGYQFKSHSDTEVILNAYIEYGDDVVPMLEGMFSFIIYDKEKHQFFAARDRMGKKPLLIYQNSKSFFLFSELKQIVGIPGFNKDINFSAITNYLTYGSVSLPETIFKNVTSLPAGHFLKITNNQLEIKKYWSTQFSINNTITYEQAKDQVRTLVESAVRKRLISDVPLGAFLSGGIDSSIIVGLMRKFGNNTIKTFSISYDESNASFDESFYANLVARKFETDHHSIRISPQDVSDNLEKIIWNMDQPSCDAINTYFVSLSARKGVTVALSGVGADELFAGYSTFKFVNLMNRFRTSSAGVSSFNRKISSLFHKIPLSMSASWKVRTAFSVLGAFPRAIDRYNLIKQIYYPSNIDVLIHPDMLQRVSGTHTNFVNGFFENSLSDIQKVSGVEINHYLINTLLRDTDVMGMAHSLEIRAPFVDHSLIEFTNTLPDHFKIQNINTKVILKDAFKDILPREVIERKKMGFAFPLAIWLKKGRLKEMVNDCLSEESIKRRGWLDYKTVSLQKDQFFSLTRETPNAYQSYQRVWTLVVLELWARRFLDNNLLL